MRTRWALLAIPVLLAAGCSAGGDAAATTSSAATSTPATSSPTPSSNPNTKASQLAAATAGLTKAIVTSCQEQVKLQLKAPLTAVFDPVTAVPDPEADGWYTVSGHLRSSNLMGVPLGATYDCKYSLDADRKGAVKVQDLVPD